MRVQFLGLVCGALGFGGAAMADVETLSADSAFQMSQPVAVICKSGNRSTSAAEKLASEGFAHVFNVTEGMTGHLGSGDGWIKRGLPTDPFNPPMR